jgi:hypothetical protein
MSSKDFVEVTRLVVNNEVLMKEVDLLKKLIEQHEILVAALKSENAALRELAAIQRAPFGVPAPSTPGFSHDRCMFCGEIGGHRGLPCPSTAPTC